MRIVTFTNRLMINQDNDGAGYEDVEGYIGYDDDDADQDDDGSGDDGAVIVDDDDNDDGDDDDDYAGDDDYDASADDHGGDVDNAAVASDDGDGSCAEVAHYNRYGCDGYDSANDDCSYHHHT